MVSHLVKAILGGAVDDKLLLLHVTVDCLMRYPLIFWLSNNNNYNNHHQKQQKKHLKKKFKKKTLFCVVDLQIQLVSHLVKAVLGGAVDDKLLLHVTVDCLMRYHVSSCLTFDS